MTTTTTAKPTTRREKCIEMIMSKPGAKREDYGSLTIITHDPLVAAIFRGRETRPSTYYRFKSQNEVTEHIDNAKMNERRKIEAEAERQVKYDEEKKKFVTDAILYSSWGYEQTNIDYYKIISRKKDFVIMQQIGENKTFDQNFGDRGSCTPDPTVLIGEAFKKKITKFASINLNTYSWCGLWDGAAKSWSSYH